MIRKITKGILIACLTYSVSAQPPSLEKQKQQWLEEYQHTLRHQQNQRENFLQLEALLLAAEKQKRVSPEVLKRVERLQDPDYPLYEELQWQLLKAKLSTEEAKQPAILKNWIDEFTHQFPKTAERQQLAQKLFPAYYQAQQFEELIAYAQQVTPAPNQQCFVWAAKFQQLAEQLQPNPEAEQAVGLEQQFANLPEMADLLTQFSTFWIENETLDSTCNSLESYWRDQGFKTRERVKAKAIRLFQKNSKNGLANLASNTGGELADWIVSLQHLLLSPKNLSGFVKTQPVDADNKKIVLNVFPRFIKLLPEDMAEPSFALYQTWAEAWQLSDQEIRTWKITFLTRFFDNTDPIFQLWRDEQLKQLKFDPLTERRLRMAIWQKTELTDWLGLLSEESQQNDEWLYWRAKIDRARSQQIWTQLSQKRGFYPMLAAYQLKQVYQPKVPDFQSITDLQKEQWNRPLARVAELRALKRLALAKVVWLEFIKPLTFQEKVTLAEYAITQQWFDLAVEATIQAKAWDHLPLRLPNAYFDWFNVNLQSSSLHPTFAMAIARQESAWNPSARSHANAIGLMQMLPTTAAATAKKSQLPYQNEQDLLEPFQNIMLGTAHLTELNEKYPNNRILIAAAYNAGVSRVERWLARSEGNLDMDEFIASIPFYETRGYVQNVLAYDFYYQWLYGQAPLMFSPEEQVRY